MLVPGNYLQIPWFVRNLPVLSLSKSKNAAWDDFSYALKFLITILLDIIMPTQELSMPSQKKPHSSLEQKQATRLYDTVIVGAGAAGVGMAIALMHAGVENYLIIERNSVGSSFAAWPSETRFITPSFPSNSIGMLDLNSVAIGVSPAYNMRIEHPTGQDFADHLSSSQTSLNFPSGTKPTSLASKTWRMNL